MAEPQSKSGAPTPKGVLSGLFGPNFLDDPNAIPQLASSLGIGGDSSGPSPAAAPPVPPMAGVVPRNFTEWSADPNNVAKVAPPVNNMPSTGANDQIPPLIARPAADSTPAVLPQASPDAPAVPRGVAQAPAVPVAPSQPNVVPAAQSPAPDLFPSRADWLKANPNAATIPLPPHQYGTRGSIAMALSTIADNMGAALSGGQASVGRNWIQQVQAGQDYQRNLPVVTQQAQTTAYEQAQSEAAKTAGIKSTQAQTSHVEAETAALLGGGPFYEQAGKIRQQIIDLRKSGSLSDADFQKQANLILQGAAPSVRRVIDPSGDFMNQVRQLPQQPPQFKVGQAGTIEPITYRGQSFGAAPSENEPPEITAARKVALDSQQTSEFNKVDPIITSQIGPYPQNGTPEEKAAWGALAEKKKINMSAAPKIIVQQAALAAAAKNNPAALENVSPKFQQKAAEDYTKTSDEYATAVQTAQNMANFIDQARHGNKAAVQVIPLEGALEITTAQGVHRINKTEVDQLGGNVGSLYDKVAGSIKGATTGVNLTDSVINDIDKLQQGIAQRAGTLHANKVKVINQTYGAQFQPMQFDNAGGQMPAYAPPANLTPQQKAVDPKTGHKINVDNGRWVDSQTGQPI